MWFQPFPYQAQGKLEPVLGSLNILGVHTDSTVIVGNVVAFDMELTNATTYETALGGVMAGSTTPPSSGFARVRLPEAGSAARNCLAYCIFGVARTAATGSTTVFTPIDVTLVGTNVALVKAASANSAAGGCYMPVGAAGTIAICTGLTGRKIIALADGVWATTTFQGLFNGFGFGQDNFA